jgi:hypothetical protein
MTKLFLVVNTDEYGESNLAENSEGHGTVRTLTGIGLDRANAETLIFVDYSEIMNQNSLHPLRNSIKFVSDNEWSFEFFMSDGNKSETHKMAWEIFEVNANEVLNFTL